MIEIAVKDLERVTGARLCGEGTKRICRGCVIDSRRVENDSIFVAFPGERVDGNAFAPAAIEAGAAAVVLTVEPAPELLALAAERDCALLVCEDPTEFLLALAHDYRSRLSATVIGVTGSIGKTTTKDSLAKMLACRYRVHVTSGNFNNLIGMPLTILSAPADTEMLVLEMGMNATGEIARLTACAQPAIAIITKVGTSHIGMLGSRENIARAKAEIIAGMKPAAGMAAPLLVLHGEDDFTPFIVDEFAAPAGVEVLLCGAAESDDVRVSGLSVDDEGMPHFTVEFPDGEHLQTYVSVPGAQAVINVVYAASVAYRLGVSLADIDRTLGSLQITGRRQEVRRAACGARVIDDSYNAAPESMAAGLDLLCSLPCSGARIAILGEMGELGEDAPRLHAVTGAYAAAKKLSTLVCVGGDAAREMAAAARLMGMPDDQIVTLSTTEELIERMGAALGEHDLVLVKGSRFVGLDRFVEEVCAC